MPLRKCLREITYREYLTWQRWFEREWNEPSRSDWYLMQIAKEIERSNSEKPGRIQTDHKQMTFSWGEALLEDAPLGFEGPIPGGLTKEQIAEYQKTLSLGAWKNRLNMS